MRDIYRIVWRVSGGEAEPERILGLGHSLDYGNSVVLVEGKGEEGLRLGCAIEDHPTCISLGHKARRDEIQNACQAQKEIKYLHHYFFIFIYINILCSTNE